MKSNKTFGLSVLTSKQANRILPGAKKTSRIQALEARLEKRHTDPVIAANVLQWQKDRANNVVSVLRPWNEYPGGVYPETSEAWLADKACTIPFLNLPRTTQ